MNILSTILTLIIGVVLLFYGYPIFRLLLPLAGLVFGYYFGLHLFPAQPGIAFIAALALALLFAILSYTAWSLVITLSGLVIGFGFGTQLGFALHLDRNTALVSGIIFAILIAILAWRARDLMVMGQTALAGASAILFGLGDVYTPLNIMSPRTSANGLALVALIVLAAVGFFFQYGRFGSRRVYYRRR